MFNVITVLREGSQGVIAHGLAASETQLAQESPASPGNVFHHNAFYINLELKQIHVLPVGSI